MESDTIAAVSTAAGPAGIAVVRVSGPGAFAVARAVAGGVLPESFPSVRFARFRNPATGEEADEGMLLHFRGPRSYTGEDCVEFQGHGGRMPSARLLAAAIAAGARQAEPGEFMRRAFLNGKTDLSRAEAVMDFIGAASSRAAAAAHEQLEGRLSRETDAIYADILSVEADAEHLLDFDEEEIVAGETGLAQRRCRDIAGKIEELLSTWRRGAMLREGALVVLCGSPNAGKSSLMNAMLGRNRAITSPEAGTTRDVIEEPFSISGMPVRLADTAGLRHGAGAVESEGIARAEAEIKRADAAVEVIDATSPDWRGRVAAAAAAGRIPALNKIDLVPEIQAQAAGLGASPVSAKTGSGIGALLSAIARKLDAGTGEEGEIAVSERHRALLAQASGFLGRAMAALAEGPGGLAPAASSLASAARAVGAISGKVWSDDLLDAVFGKFCVGK